MRVGGRMKIGWGRLFLALCVVVASTTVSTAPSKAELPSTAAPPSKAFVDTYCATCHNQRLKTGGLALDTLDLAAVSQHAPTWEKVVVKLRAGLMPPAGMPRPQ